MERKPVKSDIWLIVGVTLLALAPLTFITLSQRSKATPLQVPAIGVGGANAPVTTSTSAPQIRYSVPPELSPDGFYAAAVPQLVYKSGSNVTASTSLGEVHIFRVADRAKVSAILLDPGTSANPQWLSDGRLVLIENGGGRIWNRNDLIRQSVVDPAQAQSFSSESGFNQTYFSHDGKIAVRQVYGGSLSAYDIVTNRPIPLKFQGQRVSNEPNLALAPVAPGNSSRPLLAVFSNRWSDPRPTPTPTAIPTPKPLTPEQQRFAAEEDKLNEELSNIVAKLDGEEDLSDAQRAQLEARAHKINRFSREGRARLFPVENNVSIPRPQPINFAQIEMRDLRSGSLKWSKRVKVDFFAPLPRFSLDGSLLLLCGVLVVDDNGNESDEGIEVLDPQSGRTLRYINARGARDDIGLYQSPNPVLAVTDSDERGRQVLRHIDLNTGETRSTWSLDGLRTLGVSSFNEFSCDAKGKTWSFLTPTGFDFFNRARITAQIQVAGF